MSLSRGDRDNCSLDIVEVLNNKRWWHPAVPEALRMLCAPLLSLSLKQQRGREPAPTHPQSTAAEHWKGRGWEVKTLALTRKLWEWRVGIEQNSPQGWRSLCLRRNLSAREFDHSLPWFSQAHGADKIAWLPNSEKSHQVHRKTRHKMYSLLTRCDLFKIWVALFLELAAGWHNSGQYLS